jgi:uncharacterized protein (UPF0276 family)
VSERGSAANTASGGQGAFPPRPPEAPYLGVGIGLRPKHYPEIAACDAAGADFFEAISENFMIPGGRPLRILGEMRERRPLVLHGVSLDLGASDALSGEYLDSLAALAERFQPAWLSDHLCWTAHGNAHLHDLLPLPHTEEAVRHVAARICAVQERLGRRIAIENVSSYARFTGDALSEGEFLARVAREADCGILLDLNNLFVNAHNHGDDADAAVAALDPARVFQIHLAGPSENGALLIDTHDHPVRDEVWALYERTLAKLGPVSTLIEWDEQIPAWERVVAEADRAREIVARACGASAQARAA